MKTLENEPFMQDDAEPYHLKMHEGYHRIETAEIKADKAYYLARLDGQIIRLDDLVALTESEALRYIVNNLRSVSAGLRSLAD